MSSTGTDNVAVAVAGPDAVFRAALAEGRISIQQCADCQQHIFYPRLLCPHCGVAAPDWVEISGDGVVYSTTVVRRKPERGGDYNVALVDLAEGVRMMSRVEGLAPDKVAIGMAVKVFVGELDGQPAVLFKPAGAE